MKLSLNWLKDYVDPKITNDELVHRLTMAGLEVEAVYDIADDVVFDLEITPNRPDCLNIIGLAREIAAICAKNLTLPKIKNFKSSRSAEFTIKIEDGKACPSYIGTLIKDVKIADSSARMKDRLQSLGLNPISNAVDITNFVLMEMGQPLHVFDFDKIVGGRIIVRWAKQNESIVTLDGIKRALDPSMLVIADAAKPIAIAGIMGGLDTAVTAQTKNVLIESAQFEMGIIRRASRSLGLKSDSSYRFERGIDVQAAMQGSNRAAGLLIDAAGGKFAGRLEAGKRVKIKERVIVVGVAEIEALLGSKIKPVMIKKALTRLGLTVTAHGSKGFKIKVPTFRGDLKFNVDVIEEVARLIGYDKLDVSFPHIQVLNIAPDSRPRTVRKKIEGVLLASGYDEAITFSLISQKDLDKTSLDSKGVGVDNALSGEHNLMRPSILPSLLHVAVTNLNRGQKELRVFEIGKCYSQTEETWTVAMLSFGRRSHDWRLNNKESVDLYDMKGALEQVFAAVGANVTFKTGTYPGLDKDCATMRLGDEVIGGLGKVPKHVLKAWGIKLGDVYFAQVNIQPIFLLPTITRKYEPIIEFPAIVRDISIAIKDSISYQTIKDVCQRLGGETLQRVHLVEEYRGEKIQQGHRGMVLSLLYQSKAGTLREEEVGAVHQRIVETLIQEYAAVHR